MRWSLWRLRFHSSRELFGIRCVGHIARITIVACYAVVVPGNLEPNEQSVQVHRERLLNGEAMMSIRHWLRTKSVRVHRSRPPRSFGILKFPSR